MVDGNKVNSVVEFTYLGSTISSNGCTGDEIQMRMAKASASFCRLRQRLWHNYHVSMRPRLRFKDTIKRNLKLRDMKTVSWTSLSQ